MRAAAIDLGKVRVGLAVADELGMLAHPRPFLDGRDERKLLAALERTARTEQIDLFIVGLPLHLNGQEGAAAHKARRFAERLARHTGLPVQVLDERLTSREATARLREQGLSERKSRSRVDSASAAVLLQSWLDRKPASS